MLSRHNSSQVWGAGHNKPSEGCQERHRRKRLGHHPDWRWPFCSIRIVSHCIDLRKPDYSERPIGNELSGMINKWLEFDIRCKLELFCFFPNIAMPSVVDNDHIVRTVIFVYEIGDFRVQSRFPFYWRYLEKFGFKVEIFGKYFVQCVHLNRTRLGEFKIGRRLNLSDLPRFLCNSCHHLPK